MAVQPILSATRVLSEDGTHWKQGLVRIVDYGTGAKWLYHSHHSMFECEVPNTNLLLTKAEFISRSPELWKQAELVIRQVDEEFINSPIFNDNHPTEVPDEPSLLDYCTII